MAIAMSQAGQANDAVEISGNVVLSSVERSRNITDKEIIRLSENPETAADWLKLARHLPNVDGGLGELAFKLRGDPRLQEVRRESADDADRLIGVLEIWREMSSGHTWGALWDTLNECGHGRAARTVFGPLECKAKLAEGYDCSVAAVSHSLEEDKTFEVAEYCLSGQEQCTVASEPVSPIALVDIAAAIPSQEKCVALASRLGFDKIRLMKITSFDPGGMTAQHILNDWSAKLGKEATGQVLFEALCAIDLRIIAEKFKHLLLGEKVYAEDSSSLDCRSQSPVDLPPKRSTSKLSDIVERPTRLQEQGEESTVASETLRALLGMLTPTPAVNNVPHFKQALSNVCPRVLENCIDVQGAMVSMRADLDQHYRQEYDQEKKFVWLDYQGERPTMYIPNTCLIEKDEAQKLMDRTNAPTGLPYTAQEQERRDYIYATPSKEKLVRLEYLYQSTDAANRHLTLVSAEGALSAAPTVTEMLPQSSSASTQAINTDIDPSLRSRLAHAKRVGIYAGAGCGKSCCCINVATSYLQHWSVFDVVLFWRLREPTVQKAKTLEELLCALHPSWTSIQAQQLSAALLATAGRGVLAVLDGIDELEADKDAYIWCVLEGKVLGEARLLVTSRPCALAKSILDTYDINLELLGFTEDQVSQFVYQRLGDDLAPKLSRFLDENERLASLMYVPLIALFVCEVFRQDPWSPPSTRSALYRKLLALLVRRSAVSKNRADLWQDVDGIMSTFDVRDFEGKAKSLLLQLSVLAQMAQENDKVIFGRQLVKAAKCSDDALSLGLVSRKSGKAEPQYSFQHLTVQEFLVAFGLSESINSEHLPPSPSTATSSAANCASALATAEEPRSARAAGTMREEGAAMTSRLVNVLRGLLSRKHSASVVVQFLAGQVSRDLLSEFFLTLNEWLHEHWWADPYLLMETEEEADNRRRLLTCLECVKEAFPDEDDNFPDTLQLPQTVSLKHTKAADLSLLAKAIKKKRNDVRELRAEFDYEEESERREDDKSSRVRTQRRRAMTALLRAVETCECVEVLVVSGPSEMNAFFDGEGWRALCDVVQHTSLKELIVEQCGLGDGEAIELATSLRNNETLRELSLWRNNIGEGVCVLADVLKRNETLELLNLDDNSYEESTGDRLRRQLQHIPRLFVGCRTENTNNY